jgi:hypothetical protein
LTEEQKSSTESAETGHHAGNGTSLKETPKKAKLVLAIVLRDMKQMHRHGLPVLLFLSVLLLFFGFLFFSMVSSALREIGVPTWTGRFVSGEEGGGGESLLTSLTLLHVVYGYAVLVTMILVSVAFSTGYGHEIKKGTVRTLICYPIGVFEITVAKLIYAALAGVIFAAPVFLLPIIGLGKPFADLLIIFITTYVVTFVTVATAALTANAITLATKKMYIRPTFLPYLFVVLSFFTTATVLKGLTAFLGFASSIFQAATTLTPLSPFHQGRLLLSSFLGGADFPNWIVFLIPLTLLIVGMWLSLRLWPDIYERE